MKIVFISGVCGSGKSSICEHIKENKLLDDYNVFDIDDLENINDYNEDNYNDFYKNSIDKAIAKSKDKDIIIFSCINHNDIFDLNLNVITRSILITCSSDELTKRLKNRDKKRNCSDNVFISDQIKYQDWFISNSMYYDYVFDNTNIDVDIISKDICNYVKNEF